ncbi:hypothetical protein QBC44DRAFT_84051 [Cladorrhinum sp. PSN332]|nr:hypothetical protein QBC44DRAFT_84051 [Cladorrhinum sp. PSN332]
MSFNNEPLASRAGDAKSQPPSSPMPSGPRVGERELGQDEPMDQETAGQFGSPTPFTVNVLNRETGCYICRMLMIECDGHKPECQNCLRDGTECCRYPPDTPDYGGIDWDLVRLTRERNSSLGPRQDLADLPVASASGSVMEGLSDFHDSEGEQDSAVRPDHSRSRSRTRSLKFSEDLDETDLDGVKYREFLKKMREQKRRMGVAYAGIWKRTIAECADAGDTDEKPHSAENNLLEGEEVSRDPIDGLKTFDWRSADEELNEFLASGTSDEDWVEDEDDREGKKPYVDTEMDRDGEFRLPFQKSSLSGKGLSFTAEESFPPASPVALEDMDSSASHVSELESILSEAPSLASSQSSIPIDVNTGAVEELRALLFLNETLRPLYEEAIHKVGAERFQRNFRRLLLRYGRALGSEATTPLQIQAARFVRFAAFRISVQIKDSLVTISEKEESGPVLEARAKVLAYLRQMEEAKTAATEDDELDGSDDESIYDPEEETALRTLETVKAFMVSSTAFSDLCASLKDWLNPDKHEGVGLLVRDSGTCEKSPEPFENTTGLPKMTPASTVKTAGHTENVPGSENTSGRPESTKGLPENEPRPPEQFLGLCKDKSDPCAEHHAPCERRPRPYQRGTPIFNGQIRRPWWKYYTNIVSDFVQNKVPKGYVRVSWNCRCGDRLRIQVPETQHQAAVAFAQQVASPNSTINSQTSISGSSTTGSTAGFESTTSRPGSPNTIPSDPDLGPDAETSGQPPDPFIPAGTKQFMLLVVNTRTPNGLRHIRKLKNVEVTDVTCSEELFLRLQTAYHDLRNSSPMSKNPFTVPKTMHYVKLQLLPFTKSGAVVGPYEVNSIPSRKEVQERRYAFSPCPPLIGSLPMPPDIFMHSFLDPADHFGPMVVSILPKKLHHQLCTASMNSTGWGFYIVEGINWPLVVSTTVVTVFGITILAIVWSECTGDIQGGMGIGQFGIGVVAVLASVWALYITIEKPDCVV